jgi:putative addiction module component (TIGR02574 family)
MSSAELLNEALKLSEEDRYALAEHLLKSIEHPIDSRTDEEWHQIVQSRLDDFKSGSSKFIPWDQAREQIFGRK